MKQPKSVLNWAILLTATVIAVYLCWLILLPFVGVIAWSVVLVITFYPVQQRLCRHTGRASLSALLSSLLVVLTILIPVLLVTGLVINEFLGLRETLHSKFEGFDLNRIHFVHQAVDWLHQHWKLEPARLGEWIRQNASDLARMAARFSFNLAGNVSGLVVSFCFTVFTMFLLFRDGERLVSRIPDLLPLEKSQSESLIQRIHDVIDGSIYGVLVIALIQGSLGGFTFWILGIPSPVLWGLVMAVASMIPLLGAAAVWVPGVVYLLLTGAWGKAIILAAFGGLVISSVDNFLRPKLVGDRIRLSELVMFFSVLGGLQLFGVLGIVAGPVLFAIAGSLLDTLKHTEAGTKALLPTTTSNHHSGLGPTSRPDDQPGAERNT